MRSRLLFVGGPLVAAALAAGLVLGFARGSGDDPGDPAAFMTELVEEIAGLGPDAIALAPEDLVAGVRRSLDAVIAAHGGNG